MMDLFLGWPLGMSDIPKSCFNSVGVITYVLSWLSLQKFGHIWLCCHYAIGWFPYYLAMALECLAQFVNTVVTAWFVFNQYSRHQTLSDIVLQCCFTPFLISMDNTIQCDICNKTFCSRGFPNHRRACEAKRSEMIQHQDRIDKAELARVKKSKPQSHCL